MGRSFGAAPTGLARLWRVGRARQRYRVVARMPYGREKAAAVVDVVRLADAAGDLDLRFAARLLATDSHPFGPEPARAIETFRWCLDLVDRGAAPHGHEPRFLHMFKLVTMVMIMDPQVPRAAVERMLDDMRRYFMVAGEPLGAVHLSRETFARQLGDRAAAAEEYRRLCVVPRGARADCVACESTLKVEHLTWLGRYEEAAATPVPHDSDCCSHQPGTLLTAPLLPYLRTGRFAEAVDAHHRGYQPFDSPVFLDATAEHLRFCGLSGNHERGLEVVRDNLHLLDDLGPAWAQLLFCAAAAQLLGQVVEAGDGDIAVPSRSTADGRFAVTAAGLRDELTERARDTARRFDHRNGTTEVSSLVTDLLAAQPVVNHLPLRNDHR